MPQIYFYPIFFILNDFFTFNIFISKQKNGSNIISTSLRLQQYLAFQIISDEKQIELAQDI